MFTVYDGIEAYAKQANAGFYQACVTAVLNNPKEQIYTPKGKVTRVRQYDAGKGGNYNKQKGWNTTYGNSKGIEWKEYRAPYDRAKVLISDAMDEEQSFAVGMTPSIELLAHDYLDNQLPSEIDAGNISTYYSQLPEENRLADETAVNKENILQTLADLEKKIFDSGFTGKTFLFMSSTAYYNLVAAIIDKHGLASNMLINKVGTVTLDTGLANLTSDNSNLLTVSFEYQEYLNFRIIKTPKDRMYSNIIMLSGDPDEEGQEAGGYVPDTSNENFCDIHLLAIPAGCGFSNIRHIVENYLMPSFMSTTVKQEELRELNKRMYGNIEVYNAGINQKANAFEYDIRTIYGGELFDNRKKYCYAVTGKVGVQSV